MSITFKSITPPPNVTTYIVIEGDTFDLIARKKYGVGSESSRLVAANPGVTEPLIVGTTINTPALPGAPKNVLQKTKSIDKDEVAILIDGERFRFWKDVKINRSMDSIDMVNFSAPFEPDTAKFRETFKPFLYKPMEITVGGNHLFTGVMVSHTPLLEKDQRIINVGGYSIPGVLNDCTMPSNSNSMLQFDGQGLRDISKSLCDAFGISVEFSIDQGAIFKLVAINSTTKVLSFLIELAKQRKVLISNDKLGKLLFQKSTNTGSPVASLKEGESPLLSITANFNPQQYYSHITGVESVVTGLKGSQYTARNSRLNGVIRPLSFKTPDTINADVKSSVEAKIGRMYADAIGYSIEVSTWRDPQGRLWEPNTTIKVHAHGAMIYKNYEFIIRSVEFYADDKLRKASLNLVVPGSFGGALPKVLPWDG